jgi:hypothetical protein
MMILTKAGNIVIGPKKSGGGGGRYLLGPKTKAYPTYGLLKYHFAFMFFREKNYFMLRTDDITGIDGIVKQFNKIIIQDLI